ncbi:phosphoenolpyruvate mutase [Paenibacillus sp. NPDC056579]|uniref:phosphoenolpyruvate mutase n=1 Tax=Paenibacillus sp. NPDC056579 TaxID=3345871 RepID=UPI003685BF57
MNPSTLRSLLQEGRLLRFLEAHNGLTGLIVDRAKVTLENGQSKAYDGMWLSSLCDSTAKGKPDIELVDFTSRLDTLHHIQEVSTKPIILDGDTGGQIEHLVFHIKTLERWGVSAIILEDKIGLKKNSLFGTEADQQQDSIAHFQSKIRACKQAQDHSDFMVIARIESLILNKGLPDALHRAAAYVQAGADGILIHSKKEQPDEIFAFLREFKPQFKDIPVVVVPSTFSSVTETELESAGVNIVIYANHLLRSAYLSMNRVAHTILQQDRAYEVESECEPIPDIIRIL